MVLWILNVDYSFSHLFIIIGKLELNYLKRQKLLWDYLLSDVKALYEGLSCSSSQNLTFKTGETSTFVLIWNTQINAKNAFIANHSRRAVMKWNEIKRVKAFSNHL